MKITMHIGEELLAKVRAAYGCESKTEAVDMAFREMARKAGFRAMVPVLTDDSNFDHMPEVEVLRPADELDV